MNTLDKSSKNYSPLQRMKLRVLVIDDEPDIRHLIQTFFLAEMDIITVKQAKSAQEAKDLIKQHEPNPFHLIISDWNLPDQSGVELLTYIRQSRHHQQASFVFLTGHTEPDKLKQAQQLKANGYIAKPVSPEGFIGILEQVVKKITLHNADLDILVLEDDAQFFETVIYEKLCHLGIKRIDHAPKIQLAQQLALNKLEKHTPYDLILIDQYLNNEQGLTFAKWLRRHPQLAHSNICLMTGNATPELLKAFAQINVKTGFIKPFNEDKINSIITDIKKVS